MKRMVIDGNSIINRAYYGVRPLTTRDGVPTNAVFGFLSILFKLLEEEHPDDLWVAFDLRAPTFRHLAYDGYKANRKGMPEELAVQMPLLKEVLDAMGIPRCELEGWEADDLIGTIAAQDTAAGWDTVVVTGDKDSLQLVSDRTRVKLVSSRMGKSTTREMTPTAFFEEYGFTPEKIVDLKALMGDASDNIPGVPGVGEKTAMDLVQRFGTVAEIYEKLPNLDGVKPGALKKLDEGRDMATLSYQLATICQSAPMDFDPNLVGQKPRDDEALYALLLKLEFSKLIDKLGLKNETAPTPQVSQGVCTSEVVTTCQRAEELLALWRTLPRITLLPLPALTGLAVEWSTPQGSAAALILEDKLEDYTGFLTALFAPDIPKVAHNVKDFIRLLLSQHLPWGGFIFDTALAAYLCAPTDGSYDLEKLSVSYFNFETQKSSLYLTPGAFSPLADPAIAMGALFSHTALITLLYDTLAPKLEELGMTALMYDMELPLCQVLAEMEERGFLVDRKALEAFGRQLSQRIDALRLNICEMAGEDFNVNSTQQLGHILFDKLGLPSVKKTKTGFSTNADVLEKLQDQHPIIPALLEYRQLTKLNSTYVEGLGKVISPDGRIHTSFQNTVTATGRLSSTEPNLQNIPVRTTLGAEMRHMFVAPPDWVLVDADYSQIELRLLAHIAHDQVMLEAFRTGIDIHTVTASQVFGIPLEEVSHEMRRRAKAVNFGIVYGISEFSLGEDIGVARWEAKEYMDGYFRTYAGVKAYMENVVDTARADGHVTTLYGRRRWLPELKSSNFNLRSFGERVALNAPIQGTAADIMKLAMIGVARALREEKLKGRLILQVHDELIVECPQEETDQVRALLVREMEGAASLAVPLLVSVASGINWGEAKE